MTTAVGGKSDVGRLFSGPVLKISMALKMYNPEKYDVRVLVAKEKDWTGEICQAVSNLIDHAGEILAGDITDEEAEVIHGIVDTQSCLCQEFLTKFHHKMLGVTAAASENVIATAGGDAIESELSAQDCIIAHHGTAAKYDLLVPDILSDGDTADKGSWETLDTVDDAEHVSVCGDTEDVTEQVLAGKVPSHVNQGLGVNDFYLAKGSGQFTYMPGMEMINNLVDHMPALRHVPVFAQILCSTSTLSVPVFAMTQSGVKAGVDSGGGRLCLISVT